MLRTLTLCALLAVGSLGCSPKECSETADCENGMRCDEDAGVCRECLSDVHCDDDNPCTLDACDLEGGCVNLVRADGVDCDDGEVCNGGAECRQGACVPVDAPDCNDGVTCTDDACVEPGGCENTPDDDFCSDDVDCTLDTCHPVDGCSNVPDDLFCDDDIACTVDTCDPVLGCDSVPDDTLCGGTSVCCEDGCTDLQSDPAHCGDCEHACDPTDSCFAGLCEAPGECLTARTPDPSLLDTDAWVATNGAEVDPSAQGFDSFGLGRLPFSAVGTPAANLPVLQTTACMPEDSPPVSLAFSLRSTSLQSLPSLTISAEVVGIGQVLAVSALGSTWRTNRRCLGEGAYEADPVIRLVTRCGDAASCGLASYEVDRVVVEPDPACPAPGLVRDGDLEEGTGWNKVSLSGTVLVVEPSPGNHALMLANAAGSCGPAARSRISVPTDSTLPNPALKFRAASFGTAPVQLGLFAAIELDPLTLPADGAWHDYSTCLGDGLGGFVWDLTLDTEPNGGVTCDQAPDRQLYLDDFVLISDPSGCP